jgi:NADPH:quinone reductase-like Zn-dependent oxidoreductase
VRVAVTTVNRTDCGLRAAHPFFVRAFTGLRRPRVHVLGTEFAGIVADAGERVQSFTIGDRVFGYAEDTFGAHAEYLAMPPAAVAPVRARRGRTSLTLASGGRCSGSEDEPAGLWLPGGGSLRLLHLLEVGGGTSV